MEISRITGASYNFITKTKDEIKTENEKTVKSSEKDASATQTSVAVNKSAGDFGTKNRTTEEYTQYLQEKFSYMNKDTTMEGIPTTVSVSPAFIAKCANDPEKAKFLEENLAALPDCAKSAVAGCLGTLTNLSYSFDADGNITVTISGSSDPDGKIATANAKRKTQEEKELAARLKEKREAQKAEEKQAEEKKAAEQLTEKLMATLESGKNTETDIVASKEQFTISDVYIMPISNLVTKSNNIDIQA